MKANRIIAAALALCMCGAAAPAMLEHEAYSVSAASLKGGYSEVTSGWLTFRVYDDHAEIIGLSTSASGTLSIPSTVNGVPVTAWNATPFKSNYDNYNNQITGIYFPETLTQWIEDSDATIHNGINLLTCFRNLAAITVSASNPAFTAKDNILYSKDMHTVYFCPRVKNLDSYTIPSTITTIFEAAFSGIGIKTLKLPSGVKQIGESAFKGCDALESVTIPEGVTSIGSFAFCGCEQLTKVSISSTVTEIGSNAFWTDPMLSAIQVAENNSNYSSLDGVLMDKAQSSLICYPAGKTDTYYTIPDSVSRIENDAFYRNPYLAFPTIPDSVTYIGEYAFSRCDSLSAVTLPKHLDKLKHDAFGNCPRLYSVSIPVIPRFIDGDAFTNSAWFLAKQKQDPMVIVGSLLLNGAACKGEVTIPDTVTEIADDAFIANKDITGITIPSSVTKIHQGVFASCENLKTVRLPDSLTTLNNTLFQFCTSLTTVNIPENAVYIAYGTFGSCSSLQSVTLPEKVKKVYEGAFNNCTNLKEVTILNRDCDLTQERLFTNSSSRDANGNYTSTFTGVIRGYAGSTAEAYAKQYGYRFEALPEDEPAWGDIDGNGAVELVDVILLNRNILGMEQLGAQSQKNADVNGDSAIDSTDSLLILKSLVSLVTLPVQS